MSLVWTAPSARFAGAIYVHEDRQAAVQFASQACSYPSRGNYIHMNLFCDCSRSKTSDAGGIAVVYRPWIPGLPRTDIDIVAAYPVNPLFDCNLGEFIALSECLLIATLQIREFAGASVLAGQRVTVRIFNDNMYNLQCLQGRRDLKPGIMALAQPVLSLIATQSAVIHQQGVQINLEAHWIPGHEHAIVPHNTADTYSRSARVRGKAYSTTSGNLWHRAEEPIVVGFLREQLRIAALNAARHIPGLSARIPPPPLINNRTSAAQRSIRAPESAAAELRSQDAPQPLANDDKPAAADGMRDRKSEQGVACEETSTHITPPDTEKETSKDRRASNHEGVSKAVMAAHWPLPPRPGPGPKAPTVPDVAEQPCPPTTSSPISPAPRETSTERRQQDSTEGEHNNSEQEHNENNNSEEELNQVDTCLGASAKRESSGTATDGGSSSREKATPAPPLSPSSDETSSSTATTSTPGSSCASTPVDSPATEESCCSNSLHDFGGPGTESSDSRDGDVSGTGGSSVDERVYRVRYVDDDDDGGGVVEVEVEISDDV